MPSPELKLLAWQQAFQNNILSPQGNSTDSFLPWVRQQQGADPATRLSVYVDAYTLRLSDALRSNYPVIHQLLGDTHFDEMARHYLSDYPSIHPSIRWFGDRLSAFLKSVKPYSAVPAMAEMAAFEWALRHTIDAADQQLLTAETLQSIAPEAWADLAFRLHPSLTILSLDWNTPQVWTALTNEAEGMAAPPQPSPQPGHWLVYRQPDLVSSWRSATALEITALNSVERGLTFGDLCEQLGDHTGDIDAVPQVVAGFLRAWVDQGLLTPRNSN